MQLGFGWGKGRRVIKTTIAHDELPAALAKHQAWVDAHLKLRMAKADLRPASTPEPTSPPPDDNDAA